MKRFHLFSLILLFPYCGFSQSHLQEFITKQEYIFSNEYNHATTTFNKLNYKPVYCGLKGKYLQLVRFQNGVPLFYITHNASAAEFIGIVSSYASSEWHEGLSGKDMYAGIWDAGHIFESHQEFLSPGEQRVFIEQETPSYKDHSTHVGGTIGAYGVNSLAKGMAYNAKLISRNFLNDLAEMGREVMERESFVSNHSYGPVSGWSYNSEEEQWYWHGDIGIDSFEDYKFGFYGSTSASLDELANLAPKYLMVVSAGNDRNEGPESQPISHKVWTDKWRGSNEIRDIDGGNTGYDCLGMNAVAKNVLTVGAVDASKNGDMAVFSAWGPTDDGRIKPDLTAPGVNVYSCLADDSDSYGYYSGTSMAAASVTGGILLLQELQEQLSPDVPLLSSTLKGILIHTCDESGLYAGPDYQFGWGIVNFDKAHKLLEENISSGGALIIEGEIEENGSIEHSIMSNSNSTIKVTVVWNDAPGSSSIPSLNPDDLKLVNDLDLSIERTADGAIYHPWVLDPANPNNAPIRGINVRDNVEQVVIENGDAGEYIIRIDGSKLQDGIQSYSLLISGHQYDLGLFPPTHLNGFYSLEGTLLTWEPPVSGYPEFYQVYCDDELIGTSEGLSFTDANIDYLNSVTYQVAACYGSEAYNRSCLSNTLKIESLPVTNLSIEEDFEFLPEWWIFQNDEYGWQWGDNSSLSSNYLKFDGNTTSFMAINSDELGNGEHVADYLISQPFVLPNSNKLEIEFNYFFNNTLYDTNDKLDLLYRKSINDSWVKIESLSSAQGWNQHMTFLETEEDDEVLQLAFYYDDNSEWGSGAAVDDFWIKDAEPFTYLDAQKQSDDIYFYTDEKLNLLVGVDKASDQWVEQINIYNLKGELVKSNIYDVYTTHVSIPMFSKRGRIIIIQVITSKTITSGKVYLQ